MTRAEVRGPAVPGRGELAAGMGFDAVNRTERRLCGPGAVASAAAAQGAAAAGGRAAVLLGGDDAAPGLQVSGGGAWVGHRVRGRDAPGGSFAFQLLAADAQQAVDHVLVAHRAARRLQRPGLCQIDADTAAALALVRLPGVDAAVDAAGAPPGAADAEATLEVLREAFAAVAGWTGRNAGPVAVDGPQDAPYAVVAAGADWTPACAAARQLAAAGVAVRVVGPALLGPLPERELRAALEGAQGIAVLDAFGGAHGYLDLTMAVRAALWDRPGRAQDRPVEPLPRAPRRPCDLAVSLRQAFGLPDGAAPAPAEDAPALRVGFAPAGPWAEAPLLGLAALLGRLGPLALDRLEIRHVTALRLACGAGAPVAAPGLDLLVAAHHGLLDETTLAALRHGGTVLLPGAAADGAAALGARARAALEGVGAQVLVQAVAAGDGPRTQTERCGYLIGGLLAAAAGAAPLPRELSRTLACLAATGLTARDDATLRAGAGAVRPLAPATDPAAVVPRGGPRLSAAAGPATPDAEWVAALRRFHVSGADALATTEPAPGLPLRPWALAPLTATEQVWGQYPIVVDADGARPFAQLAREATRSDGPLAANLPRWAQAVGECLGGADGAARPLGGALAAARDALRATLDLSDAAAQRFGADLDEAAARLPADAVVLGLGPNTLVELLARVAAAGRRARVAAFHAEVEALVQRLEARLRVDADLGDGARDPDRLAAALGAGDSFDTDALARSLPHRSGSRRLGEARTERMRHCLTELRSYLSGGVDLPDAVLLHPGLVAGDALPAGVASVVHGAGIEAAGGYFEAAARRMADLFRAVRIARLEADDAFAPSRQLALDRLDWQGLTSEELALVPPVFVLETAGRVQAHALSAFSALLRSGRPLHLVVLDEVFRFGGRRDDDPDADVRAAAADLGDLAVAHREALVLQSSLALPGHLWDGLGAVAACLRPSVAVVAVPDWTSPVPPWVQLAAAHEGRVTPAFRYDPDAGASWAERFDLAPNPEPDESWPQVTVTALEENGAPVERREAFTCAHAAALDPGLRGAFRAIPAGAWGPDQVPVADYLALSADERAQRIPYLWVVANDGGLERAVMTRRLARACAERLQAWRTLQELGGRRNEHARRAVAAAREQLAAETARARDGLEAAHAEELSRVRGTAATEAMARLAQALLAPDSGGLSAALAGPATAPPPRTPADTERADEAPPAAPPAAAPAPPPAPPAAAALGPAYIDSALCTSCHDCIHLNNRMFQYDGNKQAYIADAAGGTYAELVKAAEACPSRCIHPGAPRAGDETATPPLVERARKYT